MARLVLTVRLTPGTAHARIDEASRDGRGGFRLKARVRAVPEDGKANEALLRLLAEALHLPRTALGLEGGGRSREKRVRVEADEARIEDALDRLSRLPPAPDGR